MVKRSTTSKFPIARIKRIMQADEDVAKALELFMQDIVEKAAEQTRTTGGKRVSPYHLKRAALATETFDFLKDIVDKVPDPLETGGSRTVKRRKVARTEPKADAETDAPATVEAPAAAPSAPAEPAVKEADDSDE
ncbi:hypothetical protein MEQU1_000970 [Malassezia equina]|uniref:Transcription factor CBF/NF-Y/archaeal histone domain-containing protein n=1 Tax=Malassezia equina TaxID=1381935 RepID=A0AAF0E9L6_9BASI|nr:hypothetical protein MEQU1_000970 [Malassezia equina]